MASISQYTCQYAISLHSPLKVEREEVGIRLLKFFLKLSDSIPHKSHYVILHSSTDIKSDPLFKPHNNTEFSTFWQLLQDIIWIIFIKLSEHQLTDTLWITEILFNQCQMWKYFFYYKNIFSMKIICSWNNGNCNDINFKDFFHNN